MKRVFTNWSFLFCIMLVSSAAVAQQDWPKTISAANGDLIKIYQPQPESYVSNVLKSRAAISIVESGKTDPVFGTYWFTAQAPANGSTVNIQSLQVTDIRFPSDMDDSKIDAIKATLQNEVPKMNVRMPQQELQNALTLHQEQAKLSSTINNNPPKVIYSTKPSMLVLIDGTPKLQANSDWGVEAVVNTPYTIVKNTDGRFYLYGGKRWFTAPDATGPYSYTASVPGNLQNVQAAVDKAAAENAASGAKADNTGAKTDDNSDDQSADASAAANSNVVPQIIVSTEPAELIQSNGEPNFSPIDGTALLYVKNSSNDIFMNVSSQQYYVLLAGRWYKASNLNSSWQYIPSNELPADFAKIPEGSPKDEVLASVAGTEAANDAVMDAQVPQTAKVDRKTATSDVTYDGNPQFENITGTDMQYSVNSSNNVLSYRGRYYTVDNGVWFEAGGPNGPWTVATDRPDEVDRIPPSYPVYNMKYVYVYDVTPDYVWMGYTPGYLNTYIYGNTIVYGTGYYYRPWYGHYYWPRSYTWGFNMSYNPWYGWNVGWDYGYGWGGSWFNIVLGGGRRSNYYGCGGWWGPAAYRPIAYHNHYRNYGYYGGRARNYYSNNRTVVYNRTYNNNVYNNRRGVATVNNRRTIETRSYNRNYSNNNNFNRGRYNNNTPGYNNNNRFADGARPNNGYNNRGNYNNNNNRMAPSTNNNRVNPGYNNNNNNNYSRGNRPVTPSPGANNPGNSNPGYNNNRPASPGYQRPNNSNIPNRVQPSQPQQSTPQYSRPQQQRVYSPQQSVPQQQRVQPSQQRSFSPPARSVERPSSNGGGGGGSSRPSSGGDRGNGGGGRGDHGRRN